MTLGLIKKEIYYMWLPACIIKHRYTHTCIYVT